MKAHGNAKYTSETIQNEMLECLAEMFQEEIIREIKQSEVFSIIADETTGVTSDIITVGSYMRVFLSS